MHKSIMSLVLAPLLAAGCAVGPAYEKPVPQAGAESDFVTMVDTVDPTLPVPDEWWRLYNDPVLDALVSEALDANTDLQIAAANLEEARAVVRQARAGRLPSTTIEGGVDFGNSVQGALGADEQLTSYANASAAWEVDLFGRVRRAIDAAEADAEAVKAARDAVRVTVAAETTRAYLNACTATLSLQVAQKSYETSQESLDLVSIQHEAGSADDFDLERAGSRAATARAQIPAYAAQRDLALFELAALLGRTPDKIPDAARNCSIPPEPVAALPVGDGAALLRRRPDLRQAERGLAAATERIGIATADLYPRVSFGGVGSFLRNDIVTGDDSFTFGLGPAVSWNFPNRVAARARLEQAEARGDAALAGFEGKVLTALKEVEQALTAVASEQNQLDALREAQERSERAYQLAELKYRAGSVAYLDVLVAQADLLTARAAYASSVQRLSSARVDLFKSLGGGWREESSSL
ncbi:efflux transporter outer membrane subunit [Henriciella aquimarina]|uniref:efflux transporter outer membrane subunit n=1 Tax=Henriciella aquimarina TaxID=545261 RepID=UPI0009FCD8A6|nr:TolC family protein [Henriciella aquimarina]